MRDVYSNAAAYNYRIVGGDTEHTLRYQLLTFSAICTLFDADDNNDASVAIPENLGCVLVLYRTTRGAAVIVRIDILASAIMSRRARGVHQVGLNAG